MTMNEGTFDRTARIVVGIALLAITVTGPKTMIGLIGIVPLFTGIVGFCPLYRLVGIRTCPMQRKAQLGS